MLTNSAEKKDLYFSRNLLQASYISFLLAAGFESSAPVGDDSGLFDAFELLASILRSERLLRIGFLGSIGELSLSMGRFAQRLNGYGSPFSLLGFGSLPSTPRPTTASLFVSEKSTPSGNKSVKTKPAFLDGRLERASLRSTLSLTGFPSHS